MKKSDLFKAVFGEDYKKETYKYEPCSLTKTIAGKPYCSKCGTVYLNNEFSRWSIDKGCLSDIHPSFKAKRKLTNPMRK